MIYMIDISYIYIFIVWYIWYIYIYILDNYSEGLSCATPTASHSIPQLAAILQKRSERGYVATPFLGLNQPTWWAESTNVCTLWTNQNGDLKQPKCRALLHERCHFAINRCPNALRPITVFGLWICRGRRTCCPRHGGPGSSHTTNFQIIMIDLKTLKTCLRNHKASEHVLFQSQSWTHIHATDSINGQFRYLNRRYLPYIRPIF